jgi:UDP-2-acetamido-3-amino-2,3-dideoxy-glucuronate N-acetyltransferase
MNQDGVFIHPQALVESEKIGSGTRIWAFTHVMKGVHIGKNCNVGEHCYIESGVNIGNDVVIKNGVSLWHGLRVGDRAFLGPNCVFTNDLYPRSKTFKEPVHTVVCEGASIGANATILCDVEIGRYSLVGAGAVVTHNVVDFSLVSGNPARRRAYICRCAQKLVFSPRGVAACPCGILYQRQKQGIRPVQGISARIPG